MHYGYKEIEEAAVEIGDGWRKAVIEIEDGDTAYAPSTKWQLAGAGEIVYYLPPDGGLDLHSWAPGTFRSAIEGSRG